MNRLEAMALFVRIAELGSFSRAAEQLALPKASASTAVQQLEAELGTRLLHRTTRRVELSQDGRIYYERCRDLLADLDEMQSLFRQGPQALRGRLRVDLPLGAARHLIVPRLGEFLDAHPQVELELSSTDRRVDLVREGFDCVLRIGALGDSMLVARPLGVLRIVSVASPEYLRRYGVPRSVDDLAAHRLVHYVPTFGAKPEGFEVPDGAGGFRSIAMAGTLTVNNSDAYQAACLAGLGIIQAPAAGVLSLIEQGLLQEILPDLRAEAMPVTLLYAHRRQLSQRVRAFMNWLADCMAPHLEPLPLP